MDFYLNNKIIFQIPKETSTEFLQYIFNNTCDYYLISNGKLLNDFTNILDNSRIHLVPRLCGGKGGFGSMLRAIGAQIEKTTNREACRDLSGRRLRDINEEQRLKNWVANQADREKTAAERKRKKLEDLLQVPNTVFSDEQYERDRSELAEVVEDAVNQGMSVIRGEVSEQPTQEIQPKRRRLIILMDSDIDSDFSDENDNPTIITNSVSCSSNEDSDSPDRTLTN